MIINRATTRRPVSTPKTRRPRGPLQGRCQETDHQREVRLCDHGRRRSRQHHLPILALHVDAGWRHHPRMTASRSWSTARNPSKPVTFYHRLPEGRHSRRRRWRMTAPPIPACSSAETVSMYQSGQFDIQSIRKENPNIDIGVIPIPIPTREDRQRSSGGGALSFRARRRTPTTRRSSWAFLAEGRTRRSDRHLPAPVCYGSRTLQRPDPEVFKEMLPFGRPVPAHPNWVQISQAYFDGIQRILSRRRGRQDRHGVRRRGNRRGFSRPSRPEALASCRRLPAVTRNEIGCRTITGTCSFYPH